MLVGGGALMGGGSRGGIMTFPREGLIFGPVPGSRRVGVPTRPVWALVVMRVMSEIITAGYSERWRAWGIRPE